MRQRRLYTIITVVLIIAALCGALWFADDSNAGHFFDRAPHILDFLSWLIPKDWNDVWRALFDLPNANGSTTEEYNFADGRVYLRGAAPHHVVALRLAGGVSTVVWALSRENRAEVRWIRGHCGHGFAVMSRACGGWGLWSSWVTLTAPCRFAVPRQSAAVSPPPMMTTRLPAASIGVTANSPVRTRFASGR